MLTFSGTTSRKTILAMWLLIQGSILSADALGQSSTSPLVLSNATLPPVSTSEGDGYLDKLYAEWFKRAGLRVQLQTTPAARGLESANAGIFAGDAARVDMDSSLYPDLLQVPEPVIEVIFGGLFLDSGVRVKTFSDFEDYRVGYVRGWKIAEGLFKGKVNTVTVRNAGNLLDMLAADRIDVAFMTVAPARELARERQLGWLNRTDFEIRKTLYLYLHSSHRDKVSRMADILRDMKFDGSYDQIMSGYSLGNR
ncbi:substrate-binding periplasmic protein [Granulosicoccus sp. 3-233]|uniref:substrate-binding periplasmic protein n=1 Tax=Granulosicoccus sp. 3-233 TaxID=3417969 RepID=UPI003D33AA5D